MFRLKGEQVVEISQEDRDRLIELEESLWRPETRFDRAYMDRILAPDFFEFGRSGRIYQRADMLNTTPEPFNTKLPLEDLQVRLIDANIAQVTYISRVTYAQVLVSNRSSIWSRTDTGWQIRFHQGTPVEP